MDADVIVVGAGLAGLVAAHELTARGKRVALVDQENAGQPRRAGVLVVRRVVPRRHPRAAPARREGLLRAGLEGLAGQRRSSTGSTARRRGRVGACAGRAPTSSSRPARSAPGWPSTACKFLPTVGWAERGDLRADGHGNSVPRFHVTWGTGTGVVEPFVELARRPPRRGLVTFHHRHRVDELVVERRRGHRGARHGPRPRRRRARRRLQPRRRSASSTLHRAGGDRHHRRHRRQPRHRPPLLARAARHPARDDGHRRARRTSTAGCSTSPPTPARGWSTATACGTTPRACRTGTRSGPGTASASCPARRRCGSTRSAAACPTRACPATTRSARCGTCAPRRTSPSYDHSWFILTQKIIDKEFALSGSEQNPDITGKDKRAFLRSRRARQGRTGAGRGVPATTARTSWSPTRLEELVAGMNELTDEPLLDAAAAARARSRPATGRWPTLQQGRAGPGHPQRPPLPRRPARPGRRAAPHPRPGRRPADRGQAAHPDPQDPRRHPDRPAVARPRPRRRSRSRALRGGRGRRLRRRRRARLQRAGGHVPRRLHLQRARGGPGGCCRCLSLATPRLEGLPRPRLEVCPTSAAPPT